MKHGVFLLIFLAFTIVEAQDKVAADSIELIVPIAKEREDGLDKLPPQVFTDSSGLETWFVEERGFKAGNVAKEKAPARKRVPASKKRLRPTKQQKQKVEKRKPANTKNAKPARLPAKKKSSGVKK